MYTPLAQRVGKAVGSVDEAVERIAAVESKGNYGALGKPNSKGQKAYGKYQVMDFNIPTWSKEVLGKSLTPDEFLKDDAAQDAIAKAKIGGIYEKYGNLDDTASVWFSGRPVAEAGNAADVTGTTVPQYVAAVKGGQGKLATARAELSTAQTGGYVPLAMRTKTMM